MLALERCWEWSSEMAVGLGLERCWEWSSEMALGPGSAGAADVKVAGSGQDMGLSGIQLRLRTK